MKKLFLLFLIVGFTAQAQAKNFDCNKKTCKQMSSCEEAQYKLKQCGHQRLDRDKDNVPCESICPGG